MNELTYMDYIIESEREAFIAEKAMNDEFEKLNILFEMCSLQQRIHEIDIENKVLTESGSYDDYAILLTEANQQVSQEKQGILAKIFDWFSKLFESIHQAITGIFSKKLDPNDQVNTPASLLDGKFNSMLDGIMNILNNDIVKMFASAALGAIAKSFGDKIGAKVDELLDWFNGKLKEGGMKLVGSAIAQGAAKKLQGFGTAIMNFINKLHKEKNPEDDAEANAEQGMLKKLGSLVSGVVHKGLGMLGQAFNNPVKNGQQQATNTPQQGQPAANQPTQAAPAPTPTNPNPGAPQIGPQTTGPAMASADTEPINDGDLSLYESVFGKLEEKKEDDISDLLDMI